MKQPVLVGILSLLAIATPLMSGCGHERPNTTQAKAQPALVFAHVNVIDATGAAEKPNQMVVITGKRITAIGPEGKVRIPTGARIIEARGKYLIPGLWDLHTHLHFGTHEVLPVFVAHGITGIRDLSTDMKEIRGIRGMADSGGLLQPQILASGNMIEAGEVKNFFPKILPPIVTSYIIPNLRLADTPAQARAAVRQVASTKPDFIKLHWNLKRDIYFAVLDEARQWGLPVAGHYPMGEKVTLREIADVGQSTIEHLSWPGAATDFAALQPAEQRTLVAHLRERHVAFVPTLVTANLEGQNKFYRAEGGDNAPDSIIRRARLDPGARYISPQLWQVWQSMMTIPMEALKDPPIPLPKFNSKAEIALLREFHKAGIAILPGTDFVVPLIFPGSSLHDELAELVQRIGMTPHEALQAATRRSAELLRLDDQVGTVQPGKIADLVLLDANPLTDIANVRRINAVVLGGRFLDRQALNDLLDRAAANLR